MEIISISLLIFLIILVVILIILFLVKKTKNYDNSLGTKIENIENKIDFLSDKDKTELKLELEKMKNANNEKINEINVSLTQLINDKNASQSVDFAHRVSTLQNLINDVKLQAEPIKTVNEKVLKLDKLLSQNNKAGKAGEYFLERIFENVSGVLKNKNILFERQYQLKKTTDDGKRLIVDLFIKGSGGKFPNIPVDSKFSFNAYEKLINDELDSSNYKINKKAFEDDAKKRIYECKKYVSDIDNTVYSIMFVPSEGVFSFLAGQCANLIEQAFQNKVIIAGPNTLVSIIYSIDQYMQLFGNISEFDSRVKILEKVIKYLDNYDESLLKIGKSIDYIVEAYNDIKTKDNSLRKEYSKLEKAAKNQDLIK